MTVPAPHTQQPSHNGDPRIVARVFALTDVGRTREHNEDSFLVANLESGEPMGFEADARDMRAPAHGLLFLVADGMGGAASGELASSMASHVVLAVLSEEWKRLELPTSEAFATALRDATVEANTRIHDFAKQHPEHRGMGTTATVAGLLGDTLYVAQVGDSRAYLVRDGSAKQLTKDQSLMQRLVEAGEMTQEQAESSDRRNIILQALGPEPHVTIDLTHQRLRRGDTLILCSDGLSGLVRIDEMTRIAAESPDVGSMCQRLIDRANELGGPDNITVVAATFDGDTLDDGHSEHDTFGYNTYPLPGTLSHTTEEAPPPSPLPSLLLHPRSDPTPGYGTPAPDAASLQEEFARARAAEDDAAFGVPDDVMDDRRRRVEPIFFVLVMVAIAAAMWLLVRLLRK